MSCDIRNSMKNLQIEPSLSRLRRKDSRIQTIDRDERFIYKNIKPKKSSRALKDTFYACLISKCPGLQGVSPIIEFKADLADLRS